MSTLSIRIPDSLHHNIKELTKKEHISINQFIASAVAEKVTAMETEAYLEARAKSGNKDSYLSVLSKVRAAETNPDDL